MSQRCVVHKFGVVPYEEAWQLQSDFAADIAAGVRPPTLLLLEHPHTYTFGRRGNSDNLLWNEAELSRRGIAVHWVDRGGDVTYHGPGQLVGYPLLPLAPGGLHANSTTGESGSNRPRLPQADYIGYVRKLEDMLITALARLGVISGQINKFTGVWVQPHVPSNCRHCPPDLYQNPAKIAAIGLKVDVKGISRHGFSLNVDPDMSFWEGIIGCGLEDYPVTSLADLLESPPQMQTVMEVVMDAFGVVFGYQMEKNYEFT